MTNRLFKRLWALRPSFPLLDKELREQSKRKRLYVVRCVLFCVLAFLVFSVLRDASFFSRSQVGEGFLLIAALFLLFSTLLLLPASMASTVASEKERDSLALLLISRMRPWEIVLQKYLGRLIPAFMLAFMTLPLMGIAYSCGGFGSGIALWLPPFIFLMICYVGAYSLLCSCFFAKSLTAIIWAYVLGFVHGGVFVCMELFGLLASRSDCEHFVFYYVCMGGGTILYLLLCVFFLKRRAFPRRASPLLRFLKGLDAFWRALNSAFGGVVLIKDSPAMLAGESPLAWRERVKTPIGRLSYKLRLSIFLSIPVLISLVFLSARVGSHSGNSVCVLLFLAYFCGGAMFLSLISSSALNAERRDRTLDILLCSPLEPREMVKRRMRSAASYSTVLLVPFFIFGVAFGGFYEIGFHNSSSYRYLFFVLALWLVYFPFVRWLSCLVGLIVKNQFRAGVISLLCLFAWTCGIPFVLLVIKAFMDDGQWVAAFALVSPLVLFADIVVEGQADSLLVAGVWAALFLAMWLLLRWHCLRCAERYLRGR